MPAGVALHMANGALFGAVYANVAPLHPAAALGLAAPAAGLAEHVGLWPLGRVADRCIPHATSCRAWPATARRSRRPPGATSLFGVVLGELERRLNPPEEDVPPPYDALASPNGHGRIEHAACHRLAATYTRPPAAPE